MKSKLKVLTGVFAVLLLFGVPYLALAGNATQVDVKISYPYGQTAAVAATSGGDVVNVYITLLDDDGNPATAGPGGEEFAALTASISSNLGQPGLIDPDRFLVANDVVAFDSPDGPAARANVDYTGASPGEDVITVTFLANPAVNGNAHVNVVAPPAASLAVRTYRNLAPPTAIFSAIDPQQYNNGFQELAGSDVNYWVIAAESGDSYTYAPELEGKQVTVRAYADFSADLDNIGLDPGTDMINYEAVAIAEDTSATFENGIAQGTLTINNGAPYPFLDVVLTAAVSVGGTTIGTIQMTGAGIDYVGVAGANLNDGTDDEVDYVPMQSGGATQLVIGEDLYTNGYLIAEKSCYQVMDDGFTGPTQTAITVVQTDALGNAVEGLIARVVTGTLDTNLANHPLVDSGAGAWDIADGDYSATDYLEDGSGTDNDGAVISGDFTLSSAGLTGDDAEVFLLLSDGAGGVDLIVDTDAIGLPINAGSEVTMNITAAGGTLAVDEGDSLLITAVDGDTNAQLLSKNGFADADTSLAVTADDEDPSVTGMQITFNIYGPCTPATSAVTITMTDLSKCGMSADDSAAQIADIAPGDESQIAVTDVAAGVEYSGTLQDDPVVITSEIIADGTPNLLLDAGDLQTQDAYGNTVDTTPVYTATGTGIGFYNISAGALDLTYPPSAAGQTDTITCSVTGLPSRHFEITNIVAAASGPAGAATALELTQEGPQTIDGVLVSPAAGGEAIIRVGANGTGDTRDVNIILDGIEGAGVRDLAGNPYTLPVELTGTALTDERLVVFAPAKGVLNITASDQSTTPLDTADLSIPFGIECTVTIDPAEATVPANTTRQFCASTVCDGEAAVGDYEWMLDEALGELDTNTGECVVLTAADVDEIVSGELTVTDMANGGVTDTAAVSVTPCTPVVTVTPDGDTVDFNGTLQLSASTACDDADVSPESYTWSVTEDLGSTIDENGLYTAGDIEGTDTVTAYDAVNDAEGTAEVIVESSIDVIRDGVPRSRWVALAAFMTITGTGFDRTTTVDYAPAESALSVIPLPRLVLSPDDIWQIIIVMPSILTGVGFDGSSETVTVTVDGGTDTFEINMLPFPLDEKRSLK